MFDFFFILCLDWAGFFALACIGRVFYSLWDFNGRAQGAIDHRSLVKYKPGRSVRTLRGS